MPQNNIPNNKKKCYVLDMFPYPSGEGLHVGHPKGYIATDIYSRMKRMQGYEVIHPMGWDAFGLPAEQFAIKNKVHPRVAVEKNIANFKSQLEKINFDYDWDREINTTDPKFYKWTQWIFKQMYKKGLAFETFEPINWCPSCKTGLANEDLDGNRCERCDSIVEKKPLRQWVLKITNYADRLIDDLDDLNWPEWVKTAQRNWIGKSEGSEIDFKIKIQTPSVGVPTASPKEASSEYKFTIFTTRADTLFGCTYTVLAPEHNLIKDLLEKNIITNKSEVEKYIEEVKQKTDIERGSEGKEKTGVRLEGVMAINPANGAEVPVFIADYVLASYGTGAIMAVPAHDVRDREFAEKYSIEIKDVVAKRFVLEGNDKERDGAETLNRRVVDPIIYDNESNFYFIKDINQDGAIHFAGGGVEEGDDDIATLKKEIEEELGFTDIEIKECISPLVSTWGFRHTKNKNQRSVGKGYTVLLKSFKKVDCEIEEGRHEMFVCKKEEVLNNLSWPQHKYIFECYLNNKNILTEDGVLINSNEFDGMDSEEARKKITEKVGGKIVTRYKLRDWVFARQRYWGEPFPIVFDEDHKPFLVADSELPVKLPEVENYEPTGTGESPLANIESFKNVYGYINDDREFISVKNDREKEKLISEGKEINLFTRETNTMPQWAGSSWYYLRFLDPHNDDFLIDKDIEKEFPQVDVYVGGDHATRHLIYARFWHKFLFDIGVVSNKEPFKRLEFLGFILAEDGRKMSKRWGNIINPDDIVKEYGADTLRLYEMFMAPFDQTASWSTQNIKGSQRFVERVKKLNQKVQNNFENSLDKSCANENIIHQTIKKVGEDIENFKFNTAISQMMICLNEFEKSGCSKGELEDFLKILSPFAPSLYKELTGEDQVSAIWPKYSEDKIMSDEANISLQINGKFRETFAVALDTDEDEIKNKAKETVSYKKYILESGEGNKEQEIKKIIIVKNKLINIVF